MGVFDFVRNAGAKVGIGKSTDEIAEEERKAKNAEAAAKAKAIRVKRAAAADAAAARSEAKREAAKEKLRENSARSSELENYVTKLGLECNDLDIRYKDGTAFINGETPTYKAKQQVILAVGNCEGVETVDEDIKVVRVKADAPDEEEAVFVTVKSGDSLSKIAKEHLGDAMRYPEIFEANKPMLTDPDLIFPGQVLRIPGA